MIKISDIKSIDINPKRKDLKATVFLVAFQSDAPPPGEKMLTLSDTGEWSVEHLESNETNSGTSGDELQIIEEELYLQLMELSQKHQTK